MNISERKVKYNSNIELDIKKISKNSINSYEYIEDMYIDKNPKYLKYIINYYNINVNEYMPYTLMIYIINNIYHTNKHDSGIVYIIEYYKNRPKEKIKIELIEHALNIAYDNCIDNKLDYSNDNSFKEIIKYYKSNQRDKKTEFLPINILKLGVCQSNEENMEYVIDYFLDTERLNEVLDLNLMMIASDIKYYNFSYLMTYFDLRDKEILPIEVAQNALKVEKDIDWWYVIRDFNLNDENIFFNKIIKHYEKIYKVIPLKILKKLLIKPYIIRFIIIYCKKKNIDFKNILKYQLEHNILSIVYLNDEDIILNDDYLNTLNLIKHKKIDILDILRIKKYIYSSYFVNKVAKNYNISSKVYFLLPDEYKKEFYDSK